MRLSCRGRIKLPPSIYRRGDSGPPAPQARFLPQTRRIDIAPCLPHNIAGGSRPFERGLFVIEADSPPAFEKGPGVEMPKDFDHRRDQPGPAGLVTGADAGSVIAVEILVEQ